VAGDLLDPTGLARCAWAALVGGSDLGEHLFPGFDCDSGAVLAFYRPSQCRAELLA
jgi:hypothetical protein